jgi:hypothetical protein
MTKAGNGTAVTLSTFANGAWNDYVASTQSLTCLPESKIGYIIAQNQTIPTTLGSDSWHNLFFQASSPRDSNAFPVYNWAKLEDALSGFQDSKSLLLDHTELGLASEPGVSFTLSHFEKEVYPSVLLLASDSSTESIHEVQLDLWNGSCRACSPNESLQFADDALYAGTSQSQSIALSQIDYLTDVSHGYKTLFFPKLH